MLKTSVGIVAPSSAVPPVEFTLGVERLRAAGFTVKAHAQCLKQAGLYAGTDAERAQALIDMAVDSSVQVVWCARGGYGAAKLLPFLEQQTASRGIPEKKLLVGFSDATCLLEFVRMRWGWSTLHAPMPGVGSFSTMPDRYARILFNWVKGRPAAQPWGTRKLKLLSGQIKRTLKAEVVGGNLAVWNSLVGTPFEPRTKEKIVFLEEVTESLARIDRMAWQLFSSGALDHARAIILGTFTDCQDSYPKVLAQLPPVGSERERRRLLEVPKDEELVPLRRKVSQLDGLRQIFGEIGELLDIPVLSGLPVGHGDGLAALPMGATYRLDTDGRLDLASWDWLKQRRGN